MLEAAKSQELPQIPSKRYFTIGEVSDLCAVKPHVLRYWEQEFPQLKPTKRRGNRRYYQHHDVLMIRQIRNLLYDKGFTIGGARQQLSTANTASSEPVPPVEAPSVRKESQHALAKSLRTELESVLNLLEPELD
ncbi:MAG: MerR family transcriptional regulator [Gammaproteobacteria bacterium]|nr:MerR family transcriptional regulator [Gammaproteobacteria bacterium]MDH5731057.1 MerR family transcriptional regulator [Gammaproteobacteria bacterium]